MPEIDSSPWESSIPLLARRGFLIVPALVTFAAVGLSRAVGTSLLVLSLVGLAGLGEHLKDRTVNGTFASILPVWNNR